MASRCGSQVIWPCDQSMILWESKGRLTLRATKDTNGYRMARTPSTEGMQGQ